MQNPSHKELKNLWPKHCLKDKKILNLNMAGKPKKHVDISKNHIVFFLYFGQ
jgi:hypothetical protein